MRRFAKLIGLVVVLAAMAAVAWLLLRSGDPTSFASGKRVDLADFKGANPTGVPASLPQADKIHAAAQRRGVPLQSTLPHGLLERAVQARAPLSAQRRSAGGMESGSLSR